LREDKVSLIDETLFEQFTIMLVVKFPDKESLSNLVNFESRKGICSFFPRVVKALTTFPKQDKEKFIFFVYSKDYPRTYVFLTFSLPAKSMRHNLEE
jgi:hypothetical protein